MQEPKQCGKHPEIPKDSAHMFDEASFLVVDQPKSQHFELWEGLQEADSEIFVEFIEGVIRAIYFIVEFQTFVHQWGDVIGIRIAVDQEKMHLRCGFWHACCYFFWTMLGRT